MNPPDQPQNATPAEPLPKEQCPVCMFQGSPNVDEQWNGIRGPGARVISRKWSCPHCGSVFHHKEGWIVRTPSVPTAATEGKYDINYEFPTEEEIAVSDAALKTLRAKRKVLFPAAHSEEGEPISKGGDEPCPQSANAATAVDTTPTVINAGSNAVTGTVQPSPVAATVEETPETKAKSEALLGLPMIDYAVGMEAHAEDLERRLSALTRYGESLRRERDEFKERASFWDNGEGAKHVLKIQKKCLDAERERDWLRSCSEAHSAQIVKKDQQYLTLWKQAESMQRDYEERIATLVESWNDEHGTACALRQQVETLKGEVEEWETASPLLNGRTKNEARKLLGEVLRHTTDERLKASHGCVEVTNAINVVENLIADNNTLRTQLAAAQSELRALKGEG